MRLIGMLDSPYVRRVAISLKLLDLPFTHESVSVFRHFDHFRSINPVVKAPSFVTDDGIVLMDSALILEHIEKVSGSSLMPAAIGDHTRALRLIGLAMAACEKSVSIYYERNLRPAVHEPWVERVTGQLLLAYELLEKEIPEGWFTGGVVHQDALTTAVAWRFTQHVIADVVPRAQFPRLVALSQRAEATPAFLQTDYD